MSIMCTFTGLKILVFVFYPRQAPVCLSQAWPDFWFTLSQRPLVPGHLTVQASLKESSPSSWLHFGRASQPTLPLCNHGIACRGALASFHTPHWGRRGKGSSSDQSTCASCYRSNIRRAATLHWSFFARRQGFPCNTFRASRRLGTHTVSVLTCMLATMPYHRQGKLSSTQSESWYALDLCFQLLAPIIWQTQFRTSTWTWPCTQESSWLAQHGHALATAV